MLKNMFFTDSEEIFVRGSRADIHYLNVYSLTVIGFLLTPFSFQKRGITEVKCTVTHLCGCFLSFVLFFV